MNDALQKMVRHLEDDLRQRLDEVPALAAQVTAQHLDAKDSGRTGDSLAAFREQAVTQAAVSWVLAAVFVRFLEDNGLLDGHSGHKERWIAGHTLELVDLARDQERAYFRQEPSHGEREYLQHVFAHIGKLPGMDRLFDREHTPLWQLGPSADGARALIDLFRQRHAASGAVLLTFARPDLDTRFLGDLYQDLSEATRKRYALLQTPDFVESFLLDRALTPAIDAWGHDQVRLIDPACGSGHFLLGAFGRLLELHRHAAPAENPRVLVQRVLDQIAGVDLNPYAAAIARFRLLVAAVAACGIAKLAGAPDFRLQVAAGDSLLHGQRPAAPGQEGELFSQQELATPEATHFFASEDGEVLGAIFAQRYHVVVANPPYITVKDPGLRDLYRRRFPNSCSGKYSLVCPFIERLFDLAIDQGHVAAIVGNAFMKRQFGKKLVETVLPHWDLTHVVDTSGAYIPGHGTPTVMLFGRARGPATESVRAVMGIRGEPSTPEIPAEGKVWSAIVDQIGRPGSESEWVSVEDLARESMAGHPWSLQGGGASSTRERIEQGHQHLAGTVASIGITSFTLEDDQYLLPRHAAQRHQIGTAFLRSMALGDGIRDWSLSESVVAIFPYDTEFAPLPETEDEPHFRFLWPARTRLASCKLFAGKTKVESGFKWYEYGRLTAAKLRTPLSIAFAFVATHNHFVLDRGGKVFNRSAPVIKLPPDATVDDHLELVGLLNSSTACFWMKQMFFNKGRPGAEQTGADEVWEQRFEFDGTKLKLFPLSADKPLERARLLDQLASDLQETSPQAVMQREVPTRSALDAAQLQSLRIQQEMVALQEELDWEVYRHYGLITESLELPKEQLPPVAIGERAFEIALARKVEAEEVDSTWHRWHRVPLTTSMPDEWPSTYKQIVEKRLRLIEENQTIGMLERPEFKRRWYFQPWEDQEKKALRLWLLDHLEGDALWGGEPRLTSAAHLADRLRRDEDFRQVAALYRGHDDFDMTRLLSELAVAEGVPYLAHQRYKPSGLRKRAQWEAVWDLQRQEDTLDVRAALPKDHPDHLEAKEVEQRKAALDIPVPPKYRGTDFAQGTTWSLRGKLDVPKERFILYPGAERAADASPVLGWAGWDPLRRAQALATAYVEARDQEAWSAERLAPLLDGLAELMPWLLQWHNDLDTTLGMGLGTYFQSFLDAERRRLAELAASP